MEDKNKKSRRKFLDTGLKLGLATAFGGIGLSKITNKLNAKPENSSGDNVELMTTDGKIIEVDSSEVTEVEEILLIPISEMKDRTRFLSKIGLVYCIYFLVPLLGTIFLIVDMRMAK